MRKKPRAPSGGGGSAAEAEAEAESEAAHEADMMDEGEPAKGPKTRIMGRVRYPVAVPYPRLIMDHNHLSVLPEIDAADLTAQHVTMQFNFFKSLDLTPFTSLVYLALGGNELREFPLLPHCPTLKELHLNNNKIKQWGSLENCANLEILDVRANSLASLEGFHPPASLTRLSIANNVLALSEDDVVLLFGPNASLEGAQQDPSLPHAPAQISLPELRVLSLFGNRIDSAQPVASLLHHLPQLQELQTGANFFAAMDEDVLQFLDLFKAACPTLKWLDWQFVGDKPA